MRIDLHVHTSRYSPCGRSTPEEMVERAIAEGLEALVFTEHGYFWPKEALAALQARYPGILLLRGAEFTSWEGEDFLVYGPTTPEVMALGRDAEQLVRHVHALGGAAIIAHPYRYHPEVPVFLDQHPVDAVEIMSSNIYAHTSEKARALARRLGKPVTTNSDGHHVDSLGLYAVELHRPVHDEWELARALRADEFGLYANVERIGCQNDELSAQCDAIRRLVALDYGDEQIRAAIPGFVSLTLIRGVREGLDMLRPMRV